jgi:predicted NBD/HSP70 family sugar kinase
MSVTAGSSRDRNLRRAINALARQPGGLDRASLRDALDVSRPTVTEIVRELKSRGLAEESSPAPLLAEESSPALDSGASGRGREAKQILLTDHAGFVGAIHAGHRTIRAWLAGGDGLPLTARPRTTSNFDVDGSGIGTLVEGVKLLADLMEEAGVSVEQLRGIAVGVPAPIGRDSTIASPTFMRSWPQSDLRDSVLDMLRETFGEGDLQAPPSVFVENEATMCARGVVATGLANGAQNLAFVKVSTGIGAGLVFGGRIHYGAEGWAGELGHVRARELPADQLLECPRCLRRGCLETIASADAVVRQAAASWPGDPGALRPSDVIAAALTNPAKHPECRRAIVDAGTRIGEVLAEHVSLLDLEGIVFGGVLADAGGLFTDPVLEVIRSQGFRPEPPWVRTASRDERRVLGVWGGLALALAQTHPQIRV